MSSTSDVLDNDQISYLSKLILITILHKQNGQRPGLFKCSINDMMKLCGWCNSRPDEFKETLQYLMNNCYLYVPEDEYYKGDLDFIHSFTLLKLKHEDV